MANLIPLINKNTYKFALFGIAKSGKTCILSALALPRFSNPKGFTCTWIEQVPGHEISTNSAETISAEDPFVLGASWLKESKEKLKKGDIPKANSNTDIMRFMFEFGSKENGSISVELIDYSGELLVAQSADLAIKLKQIMRDCDGLLVLAEVPKPDSESGDLAYGLDDLSKAFATLAKERDSGPKQEWPIALLFNKWDRRLDGKEAVTNIGQEEIDNFLSESPEPPHKSLVDKITNFIGNENIHCFPVSAFGSHNINQDGKEVPKTHGQMLKTINLEDGFIWLAERSDTLKVKMLLEASEKTSWWMTQQLIIGARPDFNPAESSAIKNWFCGISALKGISATWNISHKFRAESVIRKKVNTILATFAFKALAQLASCVLIIILSAEFLEIGYDGVMYREIIARRENPAVDENILVKDEEWLTSYYVSPTYRHFLSRIFVLTKNQAKTKSIEWANKREEQAYVKINKAIEEKDTPNVISYIEEYIKVFPNGKYSTEVSVIIGRLITVEGNKKNENYLRSLETEINSFKVSKEASQEKLKSLHDNIYNLPFSPATESAEIRQNVLREIIVKKQIEITVLIANEELADFKQKYNELISKDMILDSARLLVSRQKPDIEMLKDDFRSKAPNIILKIAKIDLNNKNYDMARKKVNEIQDANVLELLTLEQINYVRMIDPEINKAEDKYLYDQFKKYMSKDTLENYIIKAPLKIMGKEVNEYKSYLGKLMGEVEVSIDCSRIDWGSNFYSYRYYYKNDIEIFANGKKIISTNQIDSKPDTSSVSLGNAKTKISLDKNIELRINITTSYGTFWASKMDGGKGTWTGTVSELQASKTIDLVPDDNAFRNKATIVLNGIPMAPSLPDWKDN
jgi:hypothetical protein